MSILFYTVLLLVLVLVLLLYFLVAVVSIRWLSHIRNEFLQWCKPLEVIFMELNFTGGNLILFLYKVGSHIFIALKVLLPSLFVHI